MAYRDNPPTACETCRDIEMTWWESLLEHLVPSTTPAQRFLQTYARALNTAFPGVPRTWYDRHREAYEKDGNEVEFQRMLRHVPTDAPVSR